MSEAAGDRETNQETVGDESMQHAGDGPASRVFEQSRKVRDDVEELATAVLDARSEWESLLRENLRAHPYLGLAAASGLGYVLGAGVSPALLRTLFGLGTRIAFAVLVRELAAPLSETANARGRRTETETETG